MADKFERTGLHAVKSERVDAPIITEYPLTLECEVVEMQDQPYGLRVLGQNRQCNRRREGAQTMPGKIDAGKIRRVCVRPDAERVLRYRRKGRSGMAQRRRSDEKIIAPV